MMSEPICNDNMCHVNNKIQGVSKTFVICINMPFYIRFIRKPEKRMQLQTSKDGVKSVSAEKQKC